MNEGIIKKALKMGIAISTTKLTMETFLSIGVFTIFFAFPAGVGSDMGGSSYDLFKSITSYRV